MKVYLLRLGTMRLDSNLLVAGTTLASRSNPNAANKMTAIPIWSVLIKHDEGNLLFDLGCVENAMQPDGWPPIDQETFPWTHEPDETMDAQLALAGLAAEDIDTVVASHFHLDHFGNIAKFTHADVYVPEEDWLLSLAKTHRKADCSSESVVYRWAMEVPVKEYHPVAIGNDFSLFPGIDIITLPGHTANLLGLLVHLSENKSLIFCSDAIYTPENYGPPVKLPGVCYDPLSYMKSIEKVRRIAIKHHADIFYSHYYELFSKWKKAPEYYE